MKEILVDIDDWSVCSMRSDTSSEGDVYAEHVIGCSEKSFTDSASWSWEFDDSVDAEGHESCWKCDERVPKEVVCIVILYNWDRKRRFGRPNA